MKQGSKEWLDSRKQMMTGSKIASVLELSPFMSYAQLMKQTIKEYQGIEDEDVKNPAMIYGTENEPVAVEQFETEYKVSVTTYGFLRHPEYEWIGCSPDGTFVDENNEICLLEVKCPFSGKIPEELPAHYYAQVQWCMEVMDIDKATVYYWTPGEQADFEVKRDHEWFKSALYHAQAFMAEFSRIKDDPLMDVHEDPDELALVQELKKVRDKIEELKVTEQAIRSVILEKCTEGIDNIFGPLKVSYVFYKGRPDYTKMAKDYDIDVGKYRGKGRTTPKFTFSKEVKANDGN